MQTVKELYKTLVDKEYSLMAHCIHYMVKERIIKFNDTVDTIDFSKVDMAKVKELEKQNYLCFHPIKVFSLKVDDYQFAFVFAKDKEEAIEFTKNELNKEPKNCVEYQIDIEMCRDNQVLNFAEMKKEHSSFPALAGYYEKELCYR